jgi:Cu/Ag efflux pump CusA
MLRSVVAFSLRFRGVVVALPCLTFGYGIYSAFNSKLGAFPEFAPPQTVIQNRSARARIRAGRGAGRPADRERSARYE